MFNIFRARRAYARVVLWVLVGMLAIGLLGTTVAWYLEPDRQPQGGRVPSTASQEAEQTETARLEELLTQYQEMLASRPGDLAVLTGYARVEMQLGELYLQEGKEDKGRELFEQAAEHYRQALAVEEDMQLRLELAAAYQALGAADQAEAELQQVLKQDPENVQALVQRGFLRESRGDWEGAAGDWRKLSTIDGIDEATKEFALSRLQAAEEKMK
ncbi:hypothetical protein Tph_c28090 [Thermacetogenium phaeum DSM 12270]|jgi:tetratricopeptide (TPR) repeat protein|uniref:Uncharacterized protein n=1 Tax=Thermacetogenium phaeum (strain ATCC BAA-254 / DSM 26808 / PB) TaxID=1089553 RepID=K4LYG6_THEPS|nr:tetratricopeptide repeat protein [Thermacetogenium phaeum]AFV12974.1 hypothetical protein Tph_c28090 [Thermacetogenium phaeum DSM 12270]MDK2881128.1 hypothetical protein [Clostridia bacterium]MDN5375484.1 hypothetical protein [Thermacetogenium sp.]